MKEVALAGLNGEQIVYSENIINKVDTIKQKLKAIEKADLAFKDSLMLDAYSSATIEGARTTIERVKMCINCPKTKSDKMVVNNIKVLNEIYNGTVINDNNIRELWEFLVNDVCENYNIRGTKYRAGKVFIGNATEIVHIPCEFRDIQRFMDKMFEYKDNDISEDSIIKAAILHFYFVYIHPFCDGNGRMARALMNEVLFNSGYTSVRKISISNQINNNLNWYYNALRLSEVHTKIGNKHVLNITPFIEYILQVIELACDRALLLVNRLSNSELLIITKMSKRGLGTEITVKTASKITALSESSTRVVLNKLVEKGILSKQLRGRKMIYTLMKV